MEQKCDTPYNFNLVHFVMSAPSISDLPEDTGAEIAFIGRSNAGKSSCLNALCSRKTLAKTSRTPGRTRLINLFELEPGKRFVDLPGYGYAKVSKQEKATWDRSLEEYLQKR
ncbi:MAG: ribosome biogenesis GTP-binding protein YsxC, partial [Succinivibrionaceae bacterium]|nr:ribosome biogenesis GTP-binding protein YsxC [Succinivibrionaceae bacterium]